MLIVVCMRLSSWLASVGTALSLLACTSEVGGLQEPIDEDIDAYIESLPYLPVDPVQVVQGAASQAQRDGDYQCTTENL